MPVLRPNGATLPVGSLRLRTPGISGTARTVPPEREGTRLAGLDARTLDLALERQAVETQASIEILRHQPGATAGDIRRGQDPPLGTGTRDRTRGARPRQECGPGCPVD